MSNNISILDNEGERAVVKNNSMKMSKKQLFTTNCGKVKYHMWIVCGGEQL